MTQQDDKADKVVNLADARKKQRTVQDRPPRKGATTDGYQEALRQQKKRGGSTSGPTSLGKRIGALVQFLAFLLICYLMLRTCQGQGL